MGQWLNGALYSLLALLFSVTWPDVSGARFAVSAALLTSLAAPLFDEIAIAVWAARRRRRHG